MMKQWAIFEQSGQLLCRLIDKAGTKSMTVTDVGKIPRNRVWMICDSDCSALIEQSVVTAAELEIETVWHAADGQNLSADELATRAGQNGQIGVLAVLQVALNNPAYFRRNNGLLCPARADDLEKARAALKRREADREFEQDLSAQLVLCADYHRQLDGQSTTEDSPSVPQQVIDGRGGLISGADKNSPLYRAVKKAADGEKNIPQFLIDIGVFTSYRECMRELFYADWPAIADAESDEQTIQQAHSESMVRGEGGEVAILGKSMYLHSPLESLPQAELPTEGAFSIDEVGTFEIDDAFSVSPHPLGMRVGVHIAVPALDNNLFADFGVNNSRLTSVYFPDEKTPMLSAAHLDIFSLRENNVCPVLSLYSIFDKEKGMLGDAETKLERVLIGGNYAPDDFDEGAPQKHAEQYRLLDDFMKCLPSLPERQRHEFRIIADEPPRVLSRPRPPVGMIVEKLMRYANLHWGNMLRTAAGGLFRFEGALTISPPADGYAWTTSPLRRAIDLANQRLLLSLLECAPPIKTDWRQLLRVFSTQQTKARHYQEITERYWVLRALAALPPDVILRGVRREKNRVRLSDYPLSAPVLAPPKTSLPPLDSVMSVRLHSIDCMAGRVLFVPAE